MIREFSGNEPTDPAKVAELVRRLLDVTDPPARLLVGADTLVRAEQAATELAERDARWSGLTASVGYDSVA